MPHLRQAVPSDASGGSISAKMNGCEWIVEEMTPCA
jgi:hypothetical protein